MTINFEELQRNYSKPSKAITEYYNKYCPDGYCVGGALCLALGIKNSYPYTEELAKAITAANPALTGSRAYNCAYQIIQNNDNYRIKAAWEILRVGLEDKGEVIKCHGEND